MRATGFVDPGSSATDFSVSDSSVSGYAPTCAALVAAPTSSADLISAAYGDSAALVCRAATASSASTTIAIAAQPDSATSLAAAIAAPASAATSASASCTGSAIATISDSGIAIAIATCLTAPPVPACPTVPACLTALSDQHRVAQAFIAAAIRLAPLLPPPSHDRLVPYRGRHRRTISACPIPPGPAARP